jgi:hypothetical protein
MKDRIPAGLLIAGLIAGLSGAGASVHAGVSGPPSGINRFKPRGE